jgi:two-component system chemotaxis response regulator CheB
VQDHRAAGILALTAELSSWEPSPLARRALAPTRPLAPFTPRRASPVELVVVAVSTGGPVALGRLLPLLPAALPVPLLVVQHLPSTFTPILAAQLHALGPLVVAEAQDEEPALPGHVYLAPGGRHLVVARGGQAPVMRLDRGPPEHWCRPAADPLFRSAAQAFGPGALAVVLTGMGRDGCAGAERVRACGGAVLAQDRDTSAVWGMPGAVARAGLADAVLPLGEIAGAIIDHIERGRARALLPFPRLPAPGQ